MAPPPRAMYKPVDAQFVLELIQKQGLVRLVTPGDNLQCGLYAVAMGLRTDDNLEPLNFNNHYSQECMQFDQLVKCVVPGGQELRANNKALPAELLPDLNGFFGVDMLSYIVAQYNHSVVGRDHMIKVYAISPDATYEISSPIGPQHPSYGKDVKKIFIHNIDNVHWEGYGHQSIGELSRHVTLSTPSKGDTVSSSDKPAVDSAPKAKTPEEKYQVAAALYRKSLGIPDDEEVTREEVLLSVAPDQGPDDDSDFEDESPAQDIPAQPQQENTVAEAGAEFLAPILLHPMAGHDVIHQDTVIARIQNPPPIAKEWKKVGTTYEFRCKVKIQKPKELKAKAKWYPDRNVEDAKGIELTFSLESAQGCAPRIRLTQDMRRENEAVDEEGNKLPAHRGSIDLAFGHIYNSADDTSVTPNQISNLKFDYKQEHPNAKITFDCMGATANNLKCLIDFPNGHDRVRNFSMNSYEREMTKKLCSLASIPKGQVLHVTLMIRCGDKEKEKHMNGQSNIVDEMLSSIPFKDNVSELLKKNMTRLSYYQYRTLTGKPMAQTGQMSKPFDTYDDGHSCLPEPARNAWQDADEAAIRLATSAHIQHVEEEVILGSLGKNEQNVTLITLGDMVLLCISFDKPLRAGLSSDERITFPSGTEIEARIYDSKPGDEDLKTDAPKSFYASGKVISNLYDIQCDALVAVDKMKAEDFPVLITPLAKSKTANIYKAYLTTKIANKNSAAMINAVAKTYARGSKVTEKWTALLNDGGYLAPVALIRSATASRKQWMEALKTLKDAQDWNDAQRAHINSFLNAPGGVALLTGSSGAGKTEVMLHLMRFCLHVGIYVLCIGEKHATLDLIVRKFIEKFPDEEPPLRAYTASLESLTSSTVEWQAGEDDLLFLDLARAELAENLNKRTRMLLSNSVQHKVIANSERSDMPEMKRMIPSGSEKGEPVYEDTTLYDFRAIFREGLAARKEHPFSDKEYWDDVRSQCFKYAYAQLRAEVIQNTKVLVATLQNVGSKEISQHFGQGVVIALFGDEAQTHPESASLIVAASCHYSPNICVWAMYGDLRQSGVINLTGRHWQDTVDVFYKQFDMSLFRRLSLAGHPVDRLTIQWRQHEKLFNILNQLHYFMGIRTKDSMKGDLDNHTTLMGRIANLPDATIAGMTDYQKRLLHVTVDSPTMKAKDTKSRANPGFAAYVTEIVLPKVREDFGNNTNEGVMLIVSYAKQKELYRRLFAKLRGQGWTEAQLPQLSTIDVAHGHEADLVIFDVVNDDYEGFLQDKKRCCVAFGRAKHQMIVISGPLAQVDQATTTQRVRDATDGDKLKTITLQRPLVHWAAYFATKKCSIDATPPQFKVPSDLTYYGDDHVGDEPDEEQVSVASGEVEPDEEGATLISADDKPKGATVTSSEVEPKPEDVTTASVSEWDVAPSNDWETPKENGGDDNMKW